MTYKLRFGDLPDGAFFRFYEDGLLLTKTGAVSYSAPQWGQLGMTTDPATKVIPVDLASSRIAGQEKKENP